MKTLSTVDGDLISKQSKQYYQCKVNSVAKIREDILLESKNQQLECYNATSITVNQK